MGWTCCGGSASAGPRESPGTERIGRARASSPSCYRWRQNRSGRTGATTLRAKRPPQPSRLPATTRLPCVRTARPCCAASTTSTVTPAAVRCSTRSHSIVRVEAGGHTRTTTRWSRFATSASASTDHGSKLACPEQSPTKSSTRSLPACLRTGTEHSSPSTSLQVHGLRNCCRSPAHASIPGVN